MGVGGDLVRLLGRERALVSRVFNDTYAHALVRLFFQKELMFEDLVGVQSFVRRELKSLRKQVQQQGINLAHGLIQLPSLLSLGEVFDVFDLLDPFLRGTSQDLNDLHHLIHLILPIEQRLQ